MQLPSAVSSRCLQVLKHPDLATDLVLYPAGAAEQKRRD
jgi:hypothetical protein